jgi:hypothetical protein
MSTALSRSQLDRARAGPAFSPISAEPTFEEMTPCERVWAPSGLAGVNVGFDKATDDVQVPPEKDSGCRHGGVRKSKAALPSIPRKKPDLHSITGQIKCKAQLTRDSVLDPFPPQPQTHAPPSTPPPRYLPV